MELYMNIFTSVFGIITYINSRLFSIGVSKSKITALAFIVTNLRCFLFIHYSFNKCLSVLVASDFAVFLIAFSLFDVCPLGYVNIKKISIFLKSK